MKNYTLYFEFFGRKMKTTVSAESCQDAKEMVIGRSGRRAMTGGAGGEP